MTLSAETASCYFNRGSARLKGVTSATAPKAMMTIASKITTKVHGRYRKHRRIQRARFS